MESMVQTWGATDRDLQRTMLGDRQVTLPSYEATLASRSTPRR